MKCVDITISAQPIGGARSGLASISAATNTPGGHIRVHDDSSDTHSSMSDLEEVADSDFASTREPSTDDELESFTSDDEPAIPSAEEGVALDIDYVGAVMPSSEEGVAGDQSGDSPSDSEGMDFAFPANDMSSPLSFNTRRAPLWDGSRESFR